MLTNLVLSLNNIGAQGATALASALDVNGVLNAPQLAVPTVERAADVAEAQVHDDGAGRRPLTPPLADNLAEQRPVAVALGRGDAAVVVPRGLEVLARN